MKLGRMLAVAVLAAGLLGSYLPAEEKPVAPAPGDKAALVSDTHPGLASGSLTYARLSDLPKGTLLKAGDLVITEKDVADEIAKAPQDVQAQLKKNGFFVLEQIAGPKLIVQIAKAEAARTGKELPSTVDRMVVDYHMGGLVEKVEATDAEVADFYQKNKDTVGDATLDQVKAGIRNYLVREKQQAVIAKYTETLGRRTPVEVSAAWVKQRAALAKDNLVDKARASGRPSLVDFGASGCQPCELMAPILEMLKKKHAGKANILFVHVREEQILAARYGVQSIPVQVFFDKDGKEMFRHVGFFPQEELEKKLAEIGVK
jgi:thiol-disulfide isomerase/thioredoxin